jgi:hypothetical protein
MIRFDLELHQLESLQTRAIYNYPMILFVLPSLPFP